MAPLPSSPFLEIPYLTIPAIVLGLVAAFLAFVIAVIVWWRILAKTGYGGLMGLLMLVPGINFIVLLVLAFDKWPIERESERMRRLLNQRL